MDLDEIAITRRRPSSPPIKRPDPWADLNKVSDADTPKYLEKKTAKPSGGTQTGAVTGTAKPLTEPPVMPDLPNADSVADDAEAVGDELGMALGIAGIKSSPPLSFRIRPGGVVTVDGDDPRAEAANRLLENDSKLRERLINLVNDAKQVEEKEVAKMRQAQLDAGANRSTVFRREALALNAIKAANGFTIETDASLKLEVTGLAKDLMNPDPTQMSDEEKMWSEMVRLTDRARRTGVVAAAQDAQAREAQDRDRRIATSRELGEEPTPVGEG